MNDMRLSSLIIFYLLIMKVYIFSIYSLVAPPQCSTSSQLFPFRFPERGGRVTLSLSDWDGAVLLWNEFPSDGNILGMEAFVDDDWAIDIIKYADGQGFHWMVRHWTGDNQCEITASYDDPAYADGFSFLSNAYRDMIVVIQKNFPEIAHLAYGKEAPQHIVPMLRKTLQLGLAATLAIGSLTSLAGCGKSEYIDYYDEETNETLIEMVDGQITMVDDAFYNQADGLNYYLDWVANEKGIAIYDIAPDDSTYQDVIDLLGDDGGVFVESGYFATSKKHPDNYLMMFTDSGHAYRIHNEELVAHFVDHFGDKQDRMIHFEDFYVNADTEAGEALLSMIPRWEDPSAELVDKWTIVSYESDGELAEAITIGMVAGMTSATTSHAYSGHRSHGYGYGSSEYGYY